jgi:hypothetical protein
MAKELRSVLVSIATLFALPWMHVSSYSMYVLEVSLMPSLYTGLGSVWPVVELGEHKI